MGIEVNNCPCELSSRNTTTNGITRRNYRYPVDESGPEDQEVGCSGKSCRSCTGRVIADCIAVCCCPCAVINLFTLTFLKLPWMIGRKCIGLVHKKKKKSIINNEKKISDRNGVSRKDEGLETKSENLKALEEVEEKVWLELYKVDQFGFGRVSVS